MMSTNAIVESVVARDAIRVGVSRAERRNASKTDRDTLDWRIFVVVSGILLMLTLLFVTGVAIQWKGYQAGIYAASGGTASAWQHVAILTYNRALGAAIVKTSGLFLGYLLVFTGALYVLRSASATFKAGVTAGGNTGTLQTSSPGLVIISLGVLLITVTILSRSDIEFGVSPPDTSSYSEYMPEQMEPVEAAPSLPTKTPPPERKK